MSSIEGSSHWTEPPFISFIYYTFSWPAEEVRLLQVKDIREKTIFIPSKRAKNNKGEHITIHQDLETLIEEHGLRKYPKDYLRLHRRSEAGGSAGRSELLL